ncbi:MAG TPA: CD225/dispanin family protein [Humibacillus sp.]|nr:CD225/dispanin family protein [Humibacillus sp.]
MTDHRDRYDGTEPDPDADRWSAWLPPLDPTSDRTGAADPVQQVPPPPPAQSSGPAPGPSLPQSPGPSVPPAPTPAQRAYPSYRSASAPPVTQAIGPRPYLGLAIFATFFGFPPLGILAIVISFSVARLHRAGRIVEAERASRRARNWAIVALVIRLIWTFIYSFVLSS